MPPLVGVAENVTNDPEHTGLAEEETETLTARFGFTFIVIPLDVAGLFEVQMVFEEVRMHLT